VVAVGCLLRDIRSRKGTTGTLAANLYIGGSMGGAWGPIRVGQWACVGFGLRLGVGRGAQLVDLGSAHHQVIVSIGSI
jgi:hypothetical protein